MYKRFTRVCQFCYGAPIRFIFTCIPGSSHLQQRSWLHTQLVPSAFDPWKNVSQNHRTNAVRQFIQDIGTMPFSYDLDLALLCIIDSKMSKGLSTVAIDYCQFGQKWAKLHRGPMWCVSPSHSPVPGSAKDTMQVSFS